MYIMITSVCNMSCNHCCMSCGKDYKGQHMSQEVFEKALELCASYGSYIVLGGGEPTLHPQFMKYLAMSIQYEQTHVQSGISPWFATNGSNTERTLDLLYNSQYVEVDFFEKMYKHSFIEWQEDPLFSMAVSQDSFHDPIDSIVFDTAKRLGVEIRNTEQHLVDAGHCDTGTSDNCCCDVFQIKPDGKIYLCGCDEAPCIGDVHQGIIADDDVLTSLDIQCIKEFEDPSTLDVDLMDTNILWAKSNIILKQKVMI